MEGYRTEEEQIEAIKKFVGDHGSKVLAVIVLSIASYFGIQGWQQKQQAKLETASNYYAELTAAVSSAEKMSATEQSKFDDAFAKLVAEYPKSVYASYATLYKAKFEVDSDELDKAAQSLQWVVDANASKAVVALANLRLARVEFARGNLDQALALLNKDTGPYAYAYKVSKGDVLVAQGKDAEAVVAYKKAAELKPAQGQFTDQILTMKIESLQAGDQSKLFPVKAETK